MMTSGIIRTATKAGALSRAMSNAMLALLGSRLNHTTSEFGPSETLREIEWHTV